MKYNIKLNFLGAIVFGCSLLSSCEKDETPYEDKGQILFSTTATFDQMAPVPANPSSGTAVFWGRFDNNSRVFNYRLNWKDLSTPVTRADFYFPSTKVQNGVLQRNIFTTTTPRPIEDSATGYIWSNTALSESELEDLKAGKVYFQLVTQSNTGGEIRGYIQVKQ